MPIPSQRSRSSSLSSLVWHWLLSVLFGAVLLLILPWLLQACGILHAPLKCRPNAAVVDRAAPLVTDPGNYHFGFKCQEILK